MSDGQTAHSLYFCENHEKIGFSYIKCTILMTAMVHFVTMYGKYIRLLARDTFVALVLVATEVSPVVAAMVR